jgi:hypothetical protein
MRDFPFGSTTADEASAMTPAKEGATTLPQVPTEDKDLGIIPPDKPAAAIDTDDRLVTHNVCHGEVLVPGAALDNADGKIFCPTCRAEFPVDTFVADRRAR